MSRSGMRTTDSIIKENEGISLPKDTTDKDIRYLENHFFKQYADIGYEIDKIKKPFRLSYHKDGEITIENTSYVGLIQLSDVRLKFQPKIKNLDFFQMLPYLKDFTKGNIFYDPYNYIEIKEGTNFIEVIGSVFNQELKTIFSKGLIKTYVKKEENLGYLKGKLLLKGQVRNDIKKNPKFNCRYYDLTYNNLENQILLSAITLLIPRITQQDLRNELIMSQMRLKDDVDLHMLTGRDCDRVCYSRVNAYYKNIISLSKLILEDSFVHSYAADKSIGINFLVNMYQLFEDFIAEMIREVIKQDQHLNKKYEVVTQHSVKTLLSPDPLSIRPDIIIKEKGKHGEYVFILDTKYKKDDHNSDYYQLIAYLLAFGKSKTGVLIYPDTNDNTDDKLGLTKDIPCYNVIAENLTQNKQILIWKINLSGSFTDNNSLTNHVKKELKGLLNDLTV